MLLLIGIAFSIFGILVIIFVAAIRRIIGGVQERKAIISEEELLKTNWVEASLRFNAKENCVCTNIYFTFEFW